jgi:hypothetical protein
MRAKKGSWRITAEQRSEIAQLYGAGEKMEFIATLFGISNGGVIYIVRKAGHPPRREPRFRKANAA